MFKIKLRRFLKELLCLHKDLDIRTMDIGTQSFNTITCKKYKKAWVKEI